MAMPPCAIIDMAHAENSSGKSDWLVMRCNTSTRVPEGAMRTAISFCSFVNGSTGSRATRPSARISI